MERACGGGTDADDWSSVQYAERRCSTVEFRDAPRTRGVTRCHELGLVLSDDLFYARINPCPNQSLKMGDRGSELRALFLGECLKYGDKPRGPTLSVGTNRLSPLWRDLEQRMSTISRIVSTNDVTAFAKDCDEASCSRRLNSLEFGELPG